MRIEFSVGRVADDTIFVFPPRKRTAFWEIAPFALVGSRALGLGFLEERRN